MGYDIPSSLDGEIDRLEELLNKFKRGEISSAEFKAHRVPFGVYEQREPNTYMVRMRCAAGAITPSQLEGVANIASQFGISDLHITSRQELQIHYVKLDDIVPVIRQLRKVGLATRGGGGNTVRNIVSPEDAGIDPQEIFDVTPYVLALTSRLIAENDSWNLPRKFKIAFSGSAEDKGYATLSDLGFIAEIKNGVKGFRVYAAGGLGAKPSAGKLLLDFVEGSEVYPVAKALKNVFYKYGNRKNKHAARLRFLWNSLGEKEFLKRFNEEYAKIKLDGFEPLRLYPVKRVTAVSGPASETAGDARDFELWKKRFVKGENQEGLYAVSIPVKLGFMSCKQAGKLARFIMPFGDDTIRMAKSQNFLIKNIPKTDLGNIYNFLKANFDDFNEPAIFGNILSCAGASTCQLGICLSRQAAKAIMRVLKESRLDLDRIGDLKLNISGCPNSCGQHPAADLGFSGKASRKGERLYPAYNVFANAVIHNGETKLSEQVGEISARDLPVLIKELLGLYLSKAGQYTNFREYIAGEGKEDLKRLCGRYKEIPDFEEDRNYYFDWDADSVFSLADRRSGECAAGLFDLIETDFNNIKETKRKLSEMGDDRAQKARLLYQVVFYAARALLITRGIEPKGEEEAFEGFSRHFIETGLIPASFKNLILIAQRKDYEALTGAENEVYGFIKAVESLYENMDDSFNFKNYSALSGLEKKEGAPAAFKDLRGIACPLNFVKTKVELSRLKPGELLEIWLDDGAPIENVPGSVKAEGHNIISQNKIDDHWSVVIEKK